MLYVVLLCCLWNKIESSVCDCAWFSGVSLLNIHLPPQHNSVSLSSLNFALAIALRFCFSTFTALWLLHDLSQCFFSVQSKDELLLRCTTVNWMKTKTSAPKIENKAAIVANTIVVFLCFLPLFVCLLAIVKLYVCMNFFVTRTSIDFLFEYFENIILCNVWMATWYCRIQICYCSNKLRWVEWIFSVLRTTTEHHTELNGATRETNEVLT